MKQYLEVLRDIYQNGTDVDTRSGKTRKVFYRQMRFSLQDGFPLVTTKELKPKSVISELLWFLEASAENNRLNNNRLKELNGTNKTIWSDNETSPYWLPHAQSPGDMGRIYGVQWRAWQKADGHTVDQLTDVIERIKRDPNDRRLVVTAWNPGEIDDMALPPCHMFFQFFVDGDTLSMVMHQRSCDMFLGVPYNITSYALLLSMVAHVTNLKPGECILALGDAHIYHDHFEAVEEQLKRTPGKLPTLWLNPEAKDIDSFTMDDIRIEDYQPQAAIKAKMAI